MQNPKISASTTKVIYITLLLFIIAYAILSHEGIYYTDDMNYSNYAVNLLNNNFDISDKSGLTFIHRLAVIAPIAALYSLFGVNLFSYTLWPILCTLGCLTIVFIVSRKISNTAAVFAMLFLSLNFYFVYFSNILYPDNIVAFFALASAAILYCHQKTNGWKALIWGSLFSLSLLFAFLAKETAVLFLPFFLLKILVDIYHKQNGSFWLWAGTSGLVVGIIYFGWYYYETGHFFYRFTEIERTNQYLPNSLTDPERTTVYRLTFQPLHTLLDTGTFPLLLFLCGGHWLNGFRRLKSTSYWTLMALSGLLILWFVSTSYSAYNPINLDGRMFNILIPALAIAAASGLRAKLANRIYTALYTILFFLAALVLQNNMSLIYGILSLYFGIHTILLQKDISIPTLLTVSVLGLTFAIRPLYFAVKPKTLYYQEHQAMIHFMQEQVQPSSTIILIPQYLYNAIPFYNRYKPVTTVNYQKHGEHLLPGKKLNVLLFENTGITDQPPFSNALPPDSLQTLYPDRELIKQIGPLKLFRLM